MNAFEVIGGNKLKGEIIPQGAKNEALQILSAVLLTDEPVSISNIPDILDVNLLIELLEDIGVKVTRTDRHSCTFQADSIDPDYLASDEFRRKGGKLRGSVMFAGPMLARSMSFIEKRGKLRQRGTHRRQVQETFTPRGRTRSGQVKGQAARKGQIERRDALRQPKCS